MARVAPGPRVTPSWRGSRSAWRRPTLRLAPLRWEDATLRTIVAHLAALLAGLIILAVQGPAPLSGGGVAVAMVIAVGLSILRVLTVRKRLAASTLVLDAAGTVVLLVGTNAPISPFYVLAIAGVWWAAHVRLGRSGLIYGGAFAAVYALLVVPQALATQLLAEAIEDVAVVLILAVLCDWFVHKRALQLSEALSAAPSGTDGLAIREGLKRVLGIMDIPVDVVLAAAQMGLTVIQAELLAYLVLGLTNREIAEATNVSEAAVRYRLTRLYRALGVKRRHQAVHKALALGLALPGEAAGPSPQR